MSGMNGDEQPEMPQEPAGDLMARAEALNTAVREMSDLMLGAVQTLVAEGWTDEQGRQIVLAAFLAGSKR